MESGITLVNGKPVSKLMKELATEKDGSVQPEVLAFLDDGYKNSCDTQIRRPMSREEHEADTVITKPPSS